VYDTFLFLLKAQIDLGALAEVPGDGPSKRPRGRNVNVDNLHDHMGPARFLHIIFKRTMGMLPIPTKFVEWFGPIPGKITVITNTRCNWRMTTKFHENRAIIDQGWTTFSISHKMLVG
jgi:hypothetical protein